MAYNYNQTTKDYSFSRQSGQGGGYNFFYNGQPISVQAYSTVSGIPVSVALKGSTNPSDIGLGSGYIPNKYGNQSVSSTPISYSPPLPPAPAPFNYSWSTAMKAGTKSVTPYYKKALSQSLQRLNIEKENYKTGYKQTIEDITKNLGQSLEDLGISRGRTTQDVGENIVSLGEEKKETMGAESRQAVRDREAALQELSQGTGIYGGMGKQQISAADVERRAMSKAVNRKYAESIGQQEKYLDRTLADIAKSEGRVKEGAETGKARAKIDLDQWVKDWGIRVSMTRREKEFQKQQDALKAASQLFQSQISKYNIGLTSAQRAAGYGL